MGDVEEKIQEGGTIEKKDVAKKDEVIAKEEKMKKNEEMDEEEMTVKTEVKEKGEMFGKEGMSDNNGVTLKENGLEQEKNMEKEEMTKKSEVFKVCTLGEMAVNMAQNIFAIIPRAVSLTLLSSLHFEVCLYLICYRLIVFMPFFIANIYMKTKNGTDIFDLSITITFIGVCSSFGCVFPVSLLEHLCIVIYLFFWIITLADNTLFISVWYSYSSDLGLWYHEGAIAFVVGLTVLSAITRCVQVVFEGRSTPRSGVDP